MRNNAAVMYHSTIVKHAVVKFHRLTTPANVNIALNTGVKNAADMNPATITSMFVNQHATLVLAQLHNKCMFNCQTGGLVLPV